MSERLFTKSCPQCGTVSPIPAPACPNCNFLFPESSGGLPGTPVRRKISFAISGSLLVLAALLLAAAAALLHARLSTTSAYQEALRIAKSSPDVHSVLGNNIHLKTTALGLTFKAYGSEFVQFSIGLAGSHGSGRLYVVANTVNGAVEFFRLKFVPDSSGVAINLAPVPARVVLPPLPPKKVYLIALGLDENEPLDWAPAYYKAKFGIDVTILSSLPLTRQLLNPSRNQLDSEQCLEYLRTSHPELDRDPSSLIVSVTSQDIYIPSYNWAFAENYRGDGRFAIVSTARLRPPSFLERLNPEWLHSRLQKMLTKNIVALYFDLPLSSDYSSLLSGGVLSGWQIDVMSGQLIGAEGHWDPFLDEGDPGVTICDLPGKPPFWRSTYTAPDLPETNTQVFTADLAVGLFVQRKTDFFLGGEHPLKLTRVYTSFDNLSRPFGIGTMDSLDIFLIGQMGVYIDLIFADGGRVHYVHAKPLPGQTADTYLANGSGGDFFSRSVAVYAANSWTITRQDGWKFYFPYRPKALSYNVTVLTGYTDPNGENYKMERDPAGNLLSVTAPSGQWLRFEHDVQNRIRRISDSSGRALTYDYDSGGRLSRVADSEGHQETYTYNEKALMLTVARGSDKPLITNEYDLSGNITGQTLASGEKFVYHYVRDPHGRSNAYVPDLMIDPNGLFTHLQYTPGGYSRWLPIPPPH
jgi:YD repeat-containing protein